MRLLQDTEQLRKEKDDNVKEKEKEQKRESTSPTVTITAATTPTNINTLIVTQDDKDKDRDKLSEGLLCVESRRSSVPSERSADSTKERGEPLSKQQMEEEKKKIEAEVEEIKRKRKARQDKELQTILQAQVEAERRKKELAAIEAKELKQLAEVGCLLIKIPSKWGAARERWATLLFFFLPSSFYSLFLQKSESIVHVCSSSSLASSAQREGDDKWRADFSYRASHCSVVTWPFYRVRETQT